MIGIATVFMSLAPDVPSVLAHCGQRDPCADGQADLEVSARYGPRL